jgi:hypothetical protein
MQLWNVYCTGDRSQCTVAKETTGELDGVTVIATDWEGGLRGTISADGNRIDWANDT